MIISPFLVYEWTEYLYPNDRLNYDRRIHVITANSVATVESIVEEINTIKDDEPLTTLAREAIINGDHYIITMTKLSVLKLVDKVQLGILEHNMRYVRFHFPDYTVRSFAEEMIRTRDRK